MCGGKGTRLRCERRRRRGKSSDTAGPPHLVNGLSKVRMTAAANHRTKSTAETALRMGAPICAGVRA